MRLNDHINVLSLFDGMACGYIAMKNVGFDIKRYVAYEIDKYAIQTATHNFPDIEECGDVFAGDFTQYEDFDFLIGGSPCFVAGTKVMTYNGIKSIEDIKVGDMVLTHKGRYRRVKDVMRRVANDTVIVNAENCGSIQCTKEHPFYTKSVIRAFNAESRGYNRVTNAEFAWLPPIMFNTTKNTSGFIKEQTYLVSVCDDIKEIPQYNGTPVSVNQYGEELQNKLNVNDAALWYVIGRWLGDGWFSYKYKPARKRLSGIKICCNKNETSYLAEKITEAGYKYTLSHEVTVDKFQISNIELATYLTQFGNKAGGKYVPGFVTRLTDELANAFLDGYFDADGHINDYIYSYSTISKDLAYGIKYMVNKYIKTSCSINVNRNTNGLIEGRNCKTKPLYNATFHSEKRNQSHYINENNYILAPYKSVTTIQEDVTVYNLSVEEDESYTANGLAVHNCTHWSIAQTKNREVTASGIGWDLFSQYVRALHEAKPKYFIYENNKSMSKEIRASIDSTFGFEAICINSALVSAQNRQRLYWVGKRNSDGTYSKVEIEQPKDKGILLRDILDNSCNLMNGDKSYVVTTSCDEAVERNMIEQHQQSTVAEPITGICQVGAMPMPNGKLSTSAGFRIYSIEAKGRYLCANGGGLGAKTGLYAIPVELDEDGILTKAQSLTNSKIYTVYKVEDGQITIKGKRYPIKLIDGYYIIRKLTVRECMRLQTVPEWYKFPVSATQAYKMCGNGWTISVIEHLLNSCIATNFKFEAIDEPVLNSKR